MEQEFDDDDELNDAVDSEIQSAISRSRGNGLAGWKAGAPDLGNAGSSEFANQMIQEDQETQAAKASGGGGGGGGGGDMDISKIVEMFGSYGG